MEKLFGRIVKPVVEIENIELVSEIQKMDYRNYFDYYRRASDYDNGYK